MIEKMTCCKCYFWQLLEVLFTPCAQNILGHGTGILSICLKIQLSMLVHRMSWIKIGFLLTVLSNKMYFCVTTCMLINLVFQIIKVSLSILIYYYC